MTASHSLPEFSPIPLGPNGGPPYAYHWHGMGGDLHFTLRSYATHQGYPASDFALIRIAGKIVEEAQRQGRYLGVMHVPSSRHPWQRTYDEDLLDDLVPGLLGPPP